MTGDEVLLENLSDLEHEQWIQWSQAVAKDLRKVLKLIEAKEELKACIVISERLDRWESYWKPYRELPDSVQEYDRVWARKVIEILRNGGDI